MNAKQAREMAIELSSLDIQEIMEDITMEAENGRLSVIVEVLVDKEIKENLEALGYKVDGQLIEW